MTLITGQVSDVGMNNASGVFYARAAEFRGNGATVVSPSPATFTITGGVVSAEIAPGPTIITLHVGPIRKDWFVNVPETDVGLGDLIATYMEYEPAVVSAAIAARDAAIEAESEAKQAAIDAEAKRAAAETAADLTGQDRLHVDNVRALLDEAYDESQAGMTLPPRLTETALNATYGSKAVVESLETGKLDKAEAETGRLSQAALDTMYSKYQPGGMVGPSVQGLYERTKPAPSSSAAGLHALKADPTVAGRIWCQGLSFSNFGYTDDGGATFVSKTASPGTGGGQIFQIAFSDTYMWALCGANADRNGQLFRSPLPDASGNGIVWTKMFDLAAPPTDTALGTPIVTGDQSRFRPQCLFVAQMHIYLLEYGGTITGGPSMYYSGGHGAAWTKAKTFTDAKHGHAVRFIDGKPTVMLGDGLFNGIGLYRSTTIEGMSSWVRISTYGEAEDGNTLYGINFFPITVEGKQMIVSEYDGALNYGPIFYPHHGSDNQKWPLLPAFQLPPQYFGTMRSLTLTPDGNLMWVHTAENGVFGPNETVWISKPPFTAAVLLDSFPSGTMFLGEPVIDGDHVWFGYYRCRAEKFLGQ